MAGNVAIIGCTVALKVAPCVQGVHDYTQSIMDYTARTSACIHVQAIIAPQLARSKPGSESRGLNHSQNQGSSQGLNQVPNRGGSAVTVTCSRVCW